MDVYFNLLVCFIVAGVLFLFLMAAQKMRQKRLDEKDDRTLILLNRKKR